MAELLGGEAIIESLQTDVKDLQLAITDIISRIGPVSCASWKFPDKHSADLDIEDLLDLYSFSDDVEECQVAHIALYELVIDRFVYLVQALTKYTQQMLSKSGGEITGTSNTSIGLSVKHYCNRQIQLSTTLQQTMSDIKTKTRKMADMESNMKKLTEQMSTQVNNDTNSESSFKFSPHKVGSAMTGFITPSKMEQIARDACSKSSQTMETAFVPCESCSMVQRNFKSAGEIIINMCQSQKLPSALQKYRPLVADSQWLSGNDVARWASEQNKDLARMNHHLENLMATINPLKEELENCQQKCKKLERRVANFDADMRKEREIQTTLQKQFDMKFKELEISHKENLSIVTEEKEEILSKKEDLEIQIGEYKDELNRQEKQLKDLESTKKSIEEELSTNKANVADIDHLKAEVTKMKDHLDEVEAKLQKSTAELSKEQGKNKSASKHSQSLQLKQETLLLRLDDLDRENEELRDNVACLEEEKEKIEEELELVQEQVKKYEKKVKENETTIDELSSEKEELQSSITTLKKNIEKLQQNLDETVERERLLIEYPDLHGPVNPDVKGTGDIVVDMENQVQANAVRIQVLETQNETLRNTITKVLSTQQRGPPKQAWEKTNGPQPLWSNENIENAQKHEEDSTWIPSKSVTNSVKNANNSGTYNDGVHTRGRYVSSVTLAPEVHIPSQTGGSSMYTKTQVDEEFLVGRSSRPASAAKRKDTPGSRPLSGNKMVMAPVNSTSIGAYKQIKKAGKLNNESNTRPQSGILRGGNMDSDRQTYSKKEMYSCEQCDKMYSRARDLEIHKSYCTG